MIAEGLESWVDIDRLSVNGFVEPLKRLPELIRILFMLRSRLLELKPACFIGIDFNFFNLLLAGMLHRGGIRTVHYVSPTIWAWRAGRINRIAKSVDLMLCLYPFETAIYDTHGVSARFVGHPRARDISRNEGVDNQPTCRQQFGFKDDDTVVALLPGSRGSEVAYSGPDFLAAARLVADRVPGCRFIVPAANPKRCDQIQAMLNERIDLDVTLVTGQSKEVMTAADVVLVNSGTATLEAMLLKKPMVMSYRLGKLTYAMVAWMVTTEFFALPNILAQESLVPEFIQDAATPEALANAVVAMLDPSNRDVLFERFDELHRLLGADAGSEGADAVLDLCGIHHVSH